MLLPATRVYSVMTSSQAHHVGAPVPLYRRISDELRAEIEGGKYRPGDRLPSELELARTHNVSRITSRQALDLLASEGLLVRRQGMGSFVALPRVTQPLVRLTDFVEDMAAAGLQPESKVLRLEEEPASPLVAERLGIAPGASVFRLDRLRLADRSPVALDWTWLAPQFAKLLMGEDLAHRTIYGILESDFGIPIMAGEYIIEASAADRDVAQHLAVRSRSPLLVFDRTSSTTGGKPVYYQRRFYRADRVRYRLTLERTPPGQSAIHRSLKQTKSHPYEGQPKQSSISLSRRRARQEPAPTNTAVPMVTRLV
jgi:GntR family transcriptional regulator